MNNMRREEFDSLDEAFISIINLLLNHGISSAPRDLPTIEVSPFSFSITNPRRRYVSVPIRRWSIAYAIAEFAWHLRASESVEEIAFYAPRWRKIARGSSTISGSSYGARVFGQLNGRPSQWEQALALLRQDGASRRAVLHFSAINSDPLDSDADIACALSLQLMLRDGRLDAICTMRSNDAILGMPYDVFLFTLIQEMAATALGCELGRYHHQVGSLHLYQSQFALAERIACSRFQIAEPMAPMDDLQYARVLVDGEANCRTSAYQVSQSTTDGGYWADLLEVIQRWTEARNDQGYLTTPRSLRDPVLNALYAQWASSRTGESGIAAS